MLLCFAESLLGVLVFAVVCFLKIFFLVFSSCVLFEGCLICLVFSFVGFLEVRFVVLVFSSVVFGLLQ